MKSQIPIRTWADWDDAVPGFVEIDLVGHEGGNPSGEFCFTLTVTDISTGWTTVGGSLACFGAAVSYAIGYVSVRRFISPLRISPLALATNQLIAAVALQAIIKPFFGWRPITTVALGTILAVVLLGSLARGFTNILYFRLIRDVGAATASAVDYVVPILAVVFSVLLIGDAVTWNVVVGGIVALLGMAVAEGRLDQRSAAPRPRQPEPLESLA